MANKYATQGALLVNAIRQWPTWYRRFPTYGDLLKQGFSTCPWKRLQEPSAQRALKKGERIERDIDKQGRVVFKIVRGRS